MQRLAPEPIALGTPLAACVRHFMAAGFEFSLLVQPQHDPHDETPGRYSLNLYDEWDGPRQPYLTAGSGFVDGPYTFADTLTELVRRWNARITGQPITAGTYPLARRRKSEWRSQPRTLAADTPIEQCLLHWQACRYQVQINSRVRAPFRGEVNAHANLRARVECYWQGYVGAYAETDGVWTRYAASPDLFPEIHRQLIADWNAHVTARNAKPTVIHGPPEFLRTAASAEAPEPEETADAFDQL
jgi:hypothetical protein